nr:SHOCT domain-containing protein [uncultured Desulfobacter sp.]
MKNIISIGLGILAIIFVFTGSSIAGWGNGQCFYPGSGMMGGGYMGFSMIFFWVILLAILVFVVRWIFSQGQSNNTSSSALDLLKKRLANGEIDIEEFKEKSKFL